MSDIIKNPRLSIIVPCYKVEKYLNRCMESLISQTLKEIEIILVDDKSPDNTPFLCDEWKNRDSRIKVIHKEENQGLGMARNTGMVAAKGDYVMFIDSDDTYELDACQRMYKTAIKYDADVVTGSFIVEKSPGIWREEPDCDKDLVLDRSGIRNYLMDMIACGPNVIPDRVHPVSVCLLCIRKSVINENGLHFMSERIIESEDTLFKTSLLQCCNRIVCLRYPFYHYFLNGASLTHSFRSKSFENLKLLYQKLHEVVHADSEFDKRIDRFIISEIRSHVSRLVESNVDRKLERISTIINDDIWNSLKCFQPSEYKGFYARWFHRLCIWKTPKLLYMYVALACRARKIMNT